MGTRWRVYESQTVVTGTGSSGDERAGGVGTTGWAWPDARADGLPGGGAVARTEPSTLRPPFEFMEARDWRAAGMLLSPSVHTETGERFDGPKFLAMNEAYPEGWSIKVVETISAGDRVASQVRVERGDNVFWCAGFYTVTDGVIVDGTEHWLSERSEPPPTWRHEFATP